MRRLRAVSLALVLACSGIARAQDGDELLLLDLCVNAECVGVAAVVLRDEQVLIETEALRAAGVNIDGLATIAVGERLFVAAEAINHGTRVHLDRDALRVDVDIAAANLPLQEVDLRTRRRADTVQLPFTAFANYSVALGRPAERSAFLDAGLGKGNLALRSTSIWDRSRGWQRGLSRFEFDRADALQRWTLGDQFAVTPDALGGGALLGGIGIERAFEQDPFLVTFPQPFVAGVLDSPGTVEVYSNGALIARRELQPGPFSLDNIGVPPGRSDVQVIVRDNFGNRRDLSGAKFYTTSTLLAPGLSDYGLRLGLPRTQAFAGSYDGDPAVQAFYRRGVAKRLTLGGRIEADEQLRNAGLNLVWQLPVGDVQLDLAGSDADGIGDGRAHALIYNLIGRKIGFSLGQRQFTADYRNLGQEAAPILSQLRLDRFGSLSLAPGLDYSLLLTFGEQRFTGGLRSHTQGANLTWRIGNRSQIVFGLQHRSGGGVDDLAAIVSLNIALDTRDRRWRPDSIGTALAWDDNGNASLRLDTQRSRPPGVGAGYDVSVLSNNDGRQQGFARVEYQTPFARLALDGEQVSGSSTVRGIVSGGVVAIGGRAYASPPIDSGFALVRTGLPDLVVQRENLDVGRSDARGDLLVRDMVPFFPSQIGVDQESIPLGYRFGKLERPVAVPRNAGAIVAFDISPMHAARGRIVLAQADGQTQSVSFGRVVVATSAGPLQSRLGGRGAFWFDELMPGRHKATVTNETATAQCLFDVPDNAPNGIADLGEVVCEIQETRQ
jgi:outer membrane usher protein